MKAARAARALGINERTLKLWIEHPDLAPYFSAPARQIGPQRELNDDDLIVANTIRALRAGVPNNAANWSGIAAELATGHRERSLPAAAVTVDTGMSVMAQHERMITVVGERDAALARVEELKALERDLRAQLADTHRLQREDQERLLRELKEAEKRAERAEVQLGLWESGRLKKE